MQQKRPGATLALLAPSECGGGRGDSNPPVAGKNPLARPVDGGVSSSPLICPGGLGPAPARSRQMMPQHGQRLMCWPPPTSFKGELTASERPPQLVRPGPGTLPSAHRTPDAAFPCIRRSFMNPLGPAPAHPSKAGQDPGPPVQPSRAGPGGTAQTPGSVPAASQAWRYRSSRAAVQPQGRRAPPRQAPPHHPGCTPAPWPGGPWRSAAARRTRSGPGGTAALGSAPSGQDRRHQLPHQGAHLRRWDVEEIARSTFTPHHHR